MDINKISQIMTANYETSKVNKDEEKKSTESLSEKLKEQDINIIGQFGVGFYSAFMVAKKVEVLSKAYGASEANVWVSSGASGYEIMPATKEA